MNAPSPPPGLARLKGAVRPVLVVAALVFLAIAVRDLARRWEPAELRLDPLWAVASVVPALVAPLIQGVAWIRLIEHLSGRTVPAGAALELYLDSQLARYTPGKVGLPAVRMAGAERLGVNARLVGTSILVELLSWLALGGAVGLGLVLLGAPAPEGLLSFVGRMAGVLLAAAGVGVLLLLAVDRRRLPGAVRRVLLLEGSGPLVPVAVPLAHGLHWLAWALHGGLLARALGADAATAVTAGGVLSVAIVVGFVALFAPAGAGVREAVIGVGTAPLLGAPAAVALGVLARGASLLSDVSVWLVARGVMRSRRRQVAAAPSKSVPLGDVAPSPRAPERVPGELP
jgi:hypothetical protein